MVKGTLHQAYMLHLREIERKRERETDRELARLLSAVRYEPRL